MALLLTATAASAPPSAATPSLRSGVSLAPPRRLKNPFMARGDAQMETPQFFQKVGWAKKHIYDAFQNT